MPEVTLYELEIPGRILGRLVVDKKGRILGVACAVKLKVPPGTCTLLVRGRQVLEIPISDVELGPNLRLKAEVSAPEIDIVQAGEILRELKSEIKLIVDATDFEQLEPLDLL